MGLITLTPKSLLLDLSLSKLTSPNLSFPNLKLYPTIKFFVLSLFVKIFSINFSGVRDAIEWSNSKEK